MVEEEEIVNLFDSYWYEHPIIFSKKPKAHIEVEPVQEMEEEVIIITNTDQEIDGDIPLDDGQQIHEEIKEEKFQRLPTLRVRSLSDQNLNLSFKTGFASDDSDISSSSCSDDFLSPSSVIPTPKLQTIHSGKEAKEFSGDEEGKTEEKEETPTKPKMSERPERGKKKKGRCRSFSELEFEEVKGFMDMGFVFSEEAKNYSFLVSLIPGLQRFGEKTDVTKAEQEEAEDKTDKHVASRPYLSEAWDVVDQRKKETPLMNLRIPASGNEIDIKDHLRIWAHSVASTVR